MLELVRHDALAHNLADPDVEVTLVAHSMGTIVACGLLRHETDLPIRHLVFMAAACRTHELFDTVVPLLERRPKATFANLMLHQANELDETFMPVVGDLVYRGSLLTWIDDFLSNSESPLERTLGRDENAMAATRLIPENVRARVTFKTFGRNDAQQIAQYGEARIPKRHGDFSNPEKQFWRPDFWKPDNVPHPEEHGE